MNDTLETIASAGVVGAGGAGFPTHVKLQAEADTLIVNAAECEPLLQKDKELLRRRTEGVLAGAEIARLQVGAQRTIIGIKETYTDVIDIVRKAAGPNTEVAPLRDAYPAGDELVLIHETTGRVVPPGQLPFHVGTVVMNVETAWNIARAEETPVVDTLLTVTGAVETPVTLEVPVGTTYAECIAAAGGVTIDDPHVIVGGVMMGTHETDLQTVVDKTTGGLIILPADHTVIRRYTKSRRDTVRINRSACDQCSFCTQLCPRWLLGHPIEPHAAMRNLLFTRDDQPADPPPTFYCVECNLCTMMACPEDLDPKSACADGKARHRELGTKPPTGPFVPRRAEIHQPNRKTPTKRLIQKLGLRKYQRPAPLSDEKLQPQQVVIKLQQHVGAPCLPIVQQGDIVQRGRLIGQVPGSDGRPVLGSPIHASIDGRVTKIDDRAIYIERQ